MKQENSERRDANEGRAFISFLTGTREEHSQIIYSEGFLWFLLPAYHLGRGVAPYRSTNFDGLEKMQGGKRASCELGPQSELEIENSSSCSTLGDSFLHVTGITSRGEWVWAKQLSLSEVPGQPSSRFTSFDKTRTGCDRGVWTELANVDSLRRGLGNALVQSLVKRGLRVYVTIRGSHSPTSNSESEDDDTYPEGVIILEGVDLSSEKGCEELEKGLKKSEGGNRSKVVFDLVIYSAGVLKPDVSINLSAPLLVKVTTERFM